MGGCAGEREYVGTYTMHLKVQVFMYDHVCAMPTAAESKNMSGQECVPDSNVENGVQGCAFMYV